MNNLGKFAAGICALFSMGCATAGQVDGVEDTAQSSAKILRENESRLNNLENSISALNTQVAQLNNRVYEVRTKNGQRTSMTVVPITQGATASTAKTAPAPALAAANAQAPAARRIDPAARPAPLTAGVQAKNPPAKAAVPPKTAATAQRSPVAANPVNHASPITDTSQTAGPSGQIAALPPEGELGLPPVEAASSDVPVPTGNSYSGNTISAHAQNQITTTDETVVPVPLIPADDLSLPPESNAVTPPPAQASAPAAATPVNTAAPAASPAPRQTAATAQRGEEAAYQQALKAARSGHTAEGIRLFRDFLQKYPSGKYTANADYWIGECLYAQGKYQDALSQFQNINSSYPKHHKNADALLKAGMSLTKIGDSAGAQQKYRQLLAEFPNSEAAKRVRAMGIR